MAGVITAATHDIYNSGSGQTITLTPNTTHDERMAVRITVALGYYYDGAGGALGGAGGWYRLDAYLMDEAGTPNAVTLQPSPNGVTCAVGETRVFFNPFVVVVNKNQQVKLTIVSPNIGGDGSVRVVIWQDPEGVVVSNTKTALGQLLTADCGTTSAESNSAAYVLRGLITGGAYDLDTDANGRIRIVHGTAAGEISITDGIVQADLAKWKGTAPSDLATIGVKKCVLVATDGGAAVADAVTTGSIWNYVSNLTYGLPALLTAIQAIQNNTRCVRTVPMIIERPDVGEMTYRVDLLLYDEVGNMEAPDAAPTVVLTNQSGTVLTGRLGNGGTMTFVSTGRYTITLTAAATDELEQLLWIFSVVEGGVTRSYGNTTLIVDTTAVDFTQADRDKLDALAAIDFAVPGDPMNLTGDYDAAKTAASQESVDDVLLQTDKLAFAGTGPYKLKATLDGETVTVSGTIGTFDDLITNWPAAPVDASEIWNFDEDGVTEGIGLRLKTNLDAKVGDAVDVLNELTINQNGEVLAYVERIMVDLVIGPIAARLAQEVVIGAISGGRLAPITLYQNSSPRLVFGPVLDGNGDPVDLQGHSMQLVVHTADGDVVFHIDDGDQITLAKSEGSEIYDLVQVQLTKSNLPTAGVWDYKMWDITAGAVLATGKWQVIVAPQPTP